MPGNQSTEENFTVSGSERPLAQVSLADIVRLRKPYRPARASGLPEPVEPFSFGIVAESSTSFGTAAQETSALYDPTRGTIYLGPNGIPEFVDFHTSEFELYKRAADSGYIPLVS